MNLFDMESFFENSANVVVEEAKSLELHPFEIGRRLLYIFDYDALIEKNGLPEEWMKPPDFKVQDLASLQMKVRLFPPTFETICSYGDRIKKHTYGHPSWSFPSNFIDLKPRVIEILQPLVSPSEDVGVLIYWLWKYVHAAVYGCSEGCQKLPQCKDWCEYNWFMITYGQSRSRRTERFWDEHLEFGVQSCACFWESTPWKPCLSCEAKEEEKKEKNTDNEEAVDSGNIPTSR